MLFPLLAALATATPCPSTGGPACLERAQQATQAGRYGRAERLTRRACSPTHPESCGPLWEEDPEAAEQVLSATEARCVAGEDAACTALGAARAEGPVPLRDFASAHRLLGLACSRKSGSACLADADLWASDHLDAPFEPATARKQLGAACEAGSGEGCRRLAMAQIEGSGGPLDVEAAYASLERACKAANAHACVDLGEWWARGRGRDPDPQAAGEAWALGCTHDPGDCAAFVRRFVEAGLVERGPLLEAAEAGCWQGYTGACAGAHILGEEDLRPSVLRWACTQGEDPSSCRAYAEEVSDHQVRRQLELEADRLERRRAPNREVSGDATRAGWVPAEASTQACVARTMAELTAPRYQGRHSPSPGLQRAEQWVADTMRELGLEVSTPEVPVPRKQDASWIEVSGVRYHAQAFPGSPAGVVDGAVAVLSEVTPASIAAVPAEASAILVPVPRPSSRAGFPVSSDRPVLAVQPHVARAAVHEGATGVAKPSLTQDVAHNVVGILPGAGTLAHEAIVVGAHLDGQGSTRSGVVRPGADDNASGTAGMLCSAAALAAHLSESAERRTLVFIAFVGEELGLHGSRAYVRAPSHDGTVAMINLDMISRSGEPVYAGSWGQWEDAMGSLAAALSLPVVSSVARDGTSDHVPFALSGIPAVHLNTGLHGDYHRPTDRMERVDPQRATGVTQLAAGLAARLATGPIDVGPVVDACQELAVRPLGAGVTPEAIGGPYRVRCVASHSAAEAMKLAAGDIIRGLKEFRWDWPTTPATLYAERPNGTCWVLGVDQAPVQRPCEALP